ncbi:nucleoside hydrolase [Pelagovum pacificum]|uniref:Nucleoside hydrolase n=1 Tax=Pelagovum pacificum TaxID=2588711 RepID=A0A5C5G8H2_9RHOB|nr:nucleoside hydrolase [Pelagovum pacificum]QQA41761.1 nucleoside hydrolase [Pelagovum pacificum]TNY31034.1 nucleoside hydrolase [Pelagovum pacificum]
MRPIVIDCDPGIDDSVAIMLALRSGAFDLKAVTTVSGNLTADLCLANALRVLDHIGAPDVPVAKGPNKPLTRPYPRDPFSHGDNGLGNLVLPDPTRQADRRFAPDVILEQAEAAGGELSLFCLGPLTDLALAVIKDPDLPKKIKDVTIIGGAFGFHAAGSTRATGDNPASEWNIYVDPEAAKIVFDAGFNLYAVGLDVATHPEVELRPSDRERLEASDTKEAAFLLGIVDFVEKRGFKSYCGLIDGLAIASLIDPDVLTFEQVAVAVETESKLALGQTIVDRRENFRWTDLPEIKAASTVDAPRYLDMLVGAFCP